MWRSPKIIVVDDGSQDGAEAEEPAGRVGGLRQQPGEREAAQRESAQQHPRDVAEALDDLLRLHAAECTALRCPRPESAPANHRRRRPAARHGRAVRRAYPERAARASSVTGPVRRSR